MRALGLSIAVLAGTAFAIPSGNRWFLDPCTGGQCPLASGQTNGNRTCVSNVCLPEVRLAASIDNAGGMTLPGIAAVPYSTVLTTTRTAFERWTLPNTSCAPSIRFAYASTTFSSPAGVANVNITDDENNVIWFSGANWRHSSVTLGLTTNAWYPNGELSDSDMEMNASTVTWSSTGSSGDYDYESVLTHEAGHYIGFSHTPDSVAVMFANLTPGEIKRNLQGPDISDVCTVYPGSTGSQGSSCSTQATCQSPLVCEGPQGSSTKVCTQDCASATSTCPTGFSCQASTSGFACLPRVGTPDMCKFCTGGQDCSTGACLTDGMGHNWCSMACNPNVTGQCGSGFACQATTAGNYCFPTAGCTSQCTAANVSTNCAPGYACTGGTCTPTGATGDRCEVSEICANCNACATDDANPQIAFCRACCNGGAPLCMGCSSTTCSPVGGAPTMCLSIPQRNEQLCYPGSGSATCQACSGAMPCAGAAQCVAGKCRAACNPQSPGACPACLPSVNGGICACGSAEIADANQPCSNSGATLAICRSGLSCINGFCRRRCTVGDPNSCLAGTTCQLSAGVEVCIPSDSGKQCSPCRTAPPACDPGLECYNNRCYPPCTITLANQCGTCVQTQPDPPAGNGGGVCACPDQVVGPGASCLLAAGISACQPGTKCISGVCQARCNPSDIFSCPIGTICKPLFNDNYCTIDTSGEGGGSAGGGTTSSAGGRPSGVGGGTAGGGLVVVNNMGCACQGTDAGVLAWLLAPLLGRRRRSSRPS